MNIWDGAKAIASNALNGLQSMNDDILEYKAHYEYYDTKKLIRMYRSTSYSLQKRIAIGNILKDRGVTSLNEY